ncbi:UNVERIFIED_CONTAM: dTDP-4-amino-4,6-dideoxygalactose transaminase [Brevibacillus sp. OAP136]
MKIPMLDLNPEIDLLWEELMQAMQQVLRSGHFIMGSQGKAFESEVARYLGCKHAIGLNSGTDALVIALRAAGIGPGDEVITTPFTFFATAEAISHVGAVPVFVDVVQETLNLDAKALEQAITPRTKAVIPVHLYGNPCDLEPIMAIARQHGLRVIEDVAQAFGGEYRGKKVGTWGDAGCFSFFPTKNLGAYGDGGLLVTDDDELAEQARMLRQHGAKRKYFNEVIGYNSRLDELQAAILRVKLQRIEEFNEGRIQAASYYRKLLEGVAGIKCLDEQADSRHVYHQMTVLITNDMRDQVQKRLAEEGIDTMIYYPVPVHKLPVYQGLGYQLPIAERAANRALSLPIWPQIGRNIQEHVIDKLKEALV